MDNGAITSEGADNGGRRRIQDRRFLVSTPHGHEQRTNWDRRSGYDRRLRQIFDGFVKAPRSRLAGRESEPKRANGKSTKIPTANIHVPS